MSAPIVNADPPTPAETDASILTLCRDLLDNRALRDRLKAELEAQDTNCAALVTDAERRVALEALGITLDEIPAARSALVIMRTELADQIRYAENRETLLEGGLTDKYTAAQRHRATCLLEHRPTPPINLLAGVQIKQVWALGMIDISELPREWMAPNMTTIRKAGRDAAPAGVQWEQRYQVALKVSK
jgi:hypothetical protein